MTPEELARNSKIVETCDRVMKIPSTEFMKRFVNYLAENMHTGWDGFAPNAEDVIFDMLGDFCSFSETLTSEDFQGFFKFGTMQLDASTGEPV